MNKNTLIGLVAVTAILIVLVVIFHQEETMEESVAVPTEFFTGFAENPQAVHTIEIKSARGELILQRAADGSGWVLPNQGGYPANQQEVRRLINSLLGVTPLEAKTNRPENFQRVGLLDVTQPGATGTQVTLKGTDGREIGSLIMGNQQSDRRGLAGGLTRTMFVRRPGENQTYLAEGEVRAPVTFTSWVIRRLINIDRTRVNTMTISRADGEIVRMQKDEPTGRLFYNPDVEEGQPGRSPAVYELMMGFLESLMFSNASPKGEFPNPAEQIMTVTARTFEGIELNFQIFREEDARVFWGSVTANLNEEVLESLLDENGELLHANLMEPDDVREMVNRVNDFHSQWLYELPHAKVLPLLRDPAARPDDGTGIQEAYVSDFEVESPQIELLPPPTPEVPFDVPVPLIDYNDSDEGSESEQDTD